MGPWFPEAKLVKMKQNSLVVKKLMEKPNGRCHPSMKAQHSLLKMKHERAQHVPPSRQAGPLPGGEVNEQLALADLSLLGYREESLIF